jgi:hypothetical protein
MAAEHEQYGPKISRDRSGADSVSHLNDEVAHYSAVVRVHAGAEGVEDAGHTHIHVGLSLVGVPKERGNEKEHDCRAESDAERQEAGISH